MRRFGSILLGVLLASSVFAVEVTDASDASARTSSSLRRYPYLTDLVRRNVTVNWATTTRSGPGPFGGVVSVTVRRTGRGAAGSASPSVPPPNISGERGCPI